jgi:probable F420-dependent oxidoreductase
VTVRISAKVPNSGPAPAIHGIGPMAARLEAAGFDGLWCSDHIVMPGEVRSRYPFGDDGRVTWDTAMPWYDAVVALTMMASATSRAEIGVAVLVLPLRQPVTFAKQIASIDALTGGRMALGVGAGWLEEEFAALDVEWRTRGSRLDEWMALLRDCWTGRPAAHRGRHYTLPEGILVLPTPAATPPLLVGGGSEAGLRRAGRSGDGWLGLQRAGHLDPDGLRPALDVLHREAADAGREPSALRVTIRIIESAGATGAVAAALPGFAAVGVDEVIVDTSWDDGGDCEGVHDQLRAAVT